MINITSSLYPTQSILANPKLKITDLENIYNRRRKSLTVL